MHAGAAGARRVNRYQEDEARFVVDRSQPHAIASARQTSSIVPGSTEPTKVRSSDRLTVNTWRRFTQEK
jgi:hypothetical protein